jgi:DNA-directed RNA polymerase specialized sigma24 family protein
MRREKGMDIDSLVQNAQRDDPEALDALLRKFNDMAFGYAFSLIGDFDTAEDIVQ